MVHFFEYKDDRMFAEDVDLTELAGKVGTPFYVYSAATLRRHVRVMQEAFEGIPTLLAYAMKANSNQAVLKVLAKAGAGADVVSGGELERAIAAGIPPEKIVFSGVGKTVAEMRRGLELGISCFNLESEPELERLNDVARRHGQGGAGLGPHQPRRRRRHPCQDLDRQEGEQVRHPLRPGARSLCPYRRAQGGEGDRRRHAYRQPDHRHDAVRERLPLLAQLVNDLRADHHRITHVDVGGGLGIPYHHDEAAPPDPMAYAEVVKRHVAPLKLSLVIEPGRLIVGNAGILVTRVEYVKEGEKNFVIVDAAMNDLIRPTLYEAHHDIQPVVHSNLPRIKADIVGPVCETGDYIAKDRKIEGVKEGDLLAVMTAGAYGAVMASTYNSRPLIPEVLVDGDKWHVIRARPSIEALIGLDSVPGLGLVRSNWYI